MIHKETDEHGNVSTCETAEINYATFRIMRMDGTAYPVFLLNDCVSRSTYVSHRGCTCKDVRTGPYAVTKECQHITGLVSLGFLASESGVIS
jgi:hypothetical protein